MELSTVVQSAVERLPGLGEGGYQISRSLHQAVLKGGHPVRKVVDMLHGTWLGHPLHPVLTDITVGAWALGSLFDAIAALRGRRRYERVADTLIATGTAASIPTLLTGLADYSTVQKPAMSTATLHALLNDVNFVLYAMSVRERRKGNRARGVTLATIGTLSLLASAWLGGHLVYGHKVGVDHSTSREGPKQWTPVLDAGELREGEPRRVETDSGAILLFKENGTVYAIGAVCSHAGGPLEKGQFDDCTVQCPWHDSVFDLRDGSIRHGPATHPQPNFETRLQDGRIEVRLTSA